MLKACILAGGEGRRLRPLTAHLPKPMVPLLGKPVLHHIVSYLSAHGIRDMALTLMYLPETIQDSLGDGAAFGVRFAYFIEHTPLGTAGGVRAAADFLRGGDFLVISGDAICDFDLQAAYRFHKEKQADVTLIAARQQEPLEYGLLFPDADGRILRFAEKPAWREVFTDLVNTGIYIVSAAVLDDIPNGQPFDFSRDLFPALMRGGRALYACTLDGYWCDIGDTAAYRRCCMDALHGSIQLPGLLDGFAAVQPGIYTEGGCALPPGVTFHAPVCLSAQATLHPGSVLGPGAVIGGAAHIGADCTITDSIISGTLDARCEANGAIVCPGAHAEAGVVLSPGSVVGAGVRLGADAHIGEHVRIYPDLAVAPSAVIRHTLTAGGGSRAVFEDDVLTGAFGTGLSPSLCFAIGSACAALCTTPCVLLGCSGRTDTVSVMHALLAGFTAAGCRVITHDGRFAACAAAGARLAGAPLSVFADTAGSAVCLRMYEADGLPLALAKQRVIEGAVARGETRYVSGRDTGSVTPLTGLPQLYAASRSLPHGASDFAVALSGRHAAVSALRTALTLSGFRIAPPGEDSGAFRIAIAQDGFSCTLSDGHRTCKPEEAQALILLAAMLETPGLTLALPAGTPVLYDRLAEQNGAVIARLTRSGTKIDALYQSQTFLHDAVGGSIYLLHFLRSAGMAFSALCALLPAFGSYREECPCQTDRAALMRRISAHYPRTERGANGGLYVYFNNGVVCVTPSAARSALKIAAESASVEFARELAVDFIRQTQELETSSDAFSSE